MNPNILCHIGETRRSIWFLVVEQRHGKVVICGHNKQDVGKALEVVENALAENRESCISGRACHSRCNGIYPSFLY